MLNHITVMGRLTRDPELRYTQSQTPVTSFRVAVDRDFAPKDGGERQADFIDCVAWRSTAEFVSKYFQKGSMAVVSGRLQMRDWTDRDGNKRTSRLMANALLISRSLCPLSFRTVEANDYRAALLLFYEQNNLSAFKKMFLEQVEFAMKEYF